MSAARRFHAIVRGRVQMVGFRYFVFQEARRLGITGWVRNGEDGVTVEVVAEGEEDAVGELENALRVGPSGARVDAVDADWSDTVEGHARFQMRH